MNSDKKTAGEIREFPESQNLNRRDFLATSAAFAFAGTFNPGLRSASGHSTASGARHQSAAATSSKVQRVIIDTDPGVDDSIAILLALRSPELKVEAITPVCGNVPLELTLPNALRLVETAGRPAVPGAARRDPPLTRPSRPRQTRPRK